MEWILSLILQLISSADDLGQATMNKSLTAVIQEHVVCRKDFEQHEEEFSGAMKIENPTRRSQVLEALRVQVLQACGVRL